MLPDPPEGQNKISLPLWGSENFLAPPPRHKRLPTALVF